MKKPDMFNGGKGYGFELEQYSVNGRAYSEQMICLMLAHCKLSFVKKVIKLIQQNVQPERGGVMAWKKKDDLKPTEKSHRFTGRKKLKSI